MMFACLIGLISSAKLCEQGVRYFQDTVVNFTLVPNEFSYFYTTPPLDKTIPIGMEVNSEYPTKIFVTDFLHCPYFDDEPFMVTIGGKKWEFGETYFRNESLRAVTIGVLSEHEQIIYISLLGQHAPEVAKSIVIKVILLAIVMISTSLIFFCFVVLPGPKKEKTDKID